jgi:hypothetical protein
MKTVSTTAEAAGMCASVAAAIGEAPRALMAASAFLGAFALCEGAEADAPPPNSLKMTCAQPRTTSPKTMEPFLRRETPMRAFILHIARGSRRLFARRTSDIVMSVSIAIARPPIAPSPFSKAGISLTSGLRIGRPFEAVRYAGADGGGRTRTALRPRDFKSLASTGFATSAYQ